MGRRQCAIVRPCMRCATCKQSHVRMGHSRARHTFETLTLGPVDIPEKSALSPKALVTPISRRVLSREASALMENLGIYRSTDLKKKIRQKCCGHIQSNVKTVKTSRSKREVKYRDLHSEERVVPVPEVLLGDCGLQLSHLALIGQDNHHGGVAPVGQHDHTGVVVKILVVVITAGSLHHVHLDLGVLVYVEFSLPGQVGIEWLLPLSCCDTKKEGK